MTIVEEEFRELMKVVTKHFEDKVKSGALSTFESEVLIAEVNKSLGLEDREGWSTSTQECEGASSYSSQGWDTSDRECW